VTFIEVIAGLVALGSCGFILWSIVVALLAMRRIYKAGPPSRNRRNGLPTPSQASTRYMRPGSL
jgi:hypothetical protein